MPPISGFCGPTYQAISPVIDAELAINLFCERSESPGAKTQIALLMAPGKTLFAQLPEAGVSSQLNINGRGFAAGAHLWELSVGGAATDRGSLGGTQPLRPCQMFANETQLLALNNGNLYVLDLTSNVLTPVNMAQFVGGAGSVMQIGFADGYFFAWGANSHTFQMSILEDGTTWSGLDISTVSLFPDNFVSMICDHREAWFLSSKKGAGYYNAGAGSPPYIPIQGAFTEFGSGATFGIVQADNTIFWIDQDERGPAVARKLVGYGNQRVSTHAVEAAWQSYATIADARAYSYQEDGHTFIVWYLPTANKTWVYDISTGYWHQRGAWNAVGGFYDADHSQSHMFFAGKHLVGDWASGNIYEQSTSIYTDNGGILRGVRRSPTNYFGNKRIYYSDFEVDVQTGLAPQPPLVDGNGDPRPAQMLLRWSNDGSFTWSPYYNLNCGFAGEFNVRARKPQVGMARKRVWEIVVTDPVPWRIGGAYVDAEAEVGVAG